MASKSSKRHEIVILGGNIAGLNTAHYLLRHTIPALKKADPGNDYHVTMVSPSSHFFWKIACPRAMINAESIPQSKIFSPIADGFSAYSSSLFTFIQGVAISISPSAHTVAITKSSDSSEQTLPYDSLIIATGTTSKSALWTLHGEHTISENAHKSMHLELPKAKSILVAGGGAVGVESAGEISAAFPEAKVTLLSGATRLLGRTEVSLGQRAESQLKDRGVEIIHNVKISSEEETLDKQTKLQLSDGSSRVVDLYVDSTGGRPNTQYVPSEWLNDKQRVKVNKDTLRVVGPDAENVYAIGDAADYSNQSFMDVDASVTPLCSSVGVDIAKSLKSSQPEATSYLGGLFGWLWGSSSVLTQKTFKPMKGIFLVPLGPSAGVGQIFVRVPAFVVTMIKGKSYFVETVDGQMDGKARGKP